MLLIKNCYLPHALYQLWILSSDKAGTFSLLSRRKYLVVKFLWVRVAGNKILNKLTKKYNKIIIKCLPSSDTAQPWNSMLFINFKEAYDNFHRATLLNTLKELHFSSKLTWLVIGVCVENALYLVQTIEGN